MTRYLGQGGTGAGNGPEQQPWDFSRAFADGGSAPPDFREPATIRTTGSLGQNRATSQGRRGQSLSWLSLSLVVASSLATSLGLYLALASVELNSRWFNRASAWMTMAVVGLCGLVLALATGIVAIVRARPRLVASLALVGVCVLPVIASLIGLKFGVDTLVAHVQDDATRIGKDAVPAVEDMLRQNGIDPGPVVRFVLDHLR